ncbi:MAG: helix-turn-helix domain-containing protein [Candidatus Lambdaproteobacteria bacterium]|nr:helix-turn-helix domain-containing protein [Candidatus Lambdaproteobacteria bacterium]
MREDNVQVVFGLKLRQFREARNLTQKVFAGKAGLSVSYLNEIEKGKKYPKADKIVQLAQSLGVPYDELVSLKLGHELNPLAAFIDSPMIRDLPLQLFGITPRELIDLISRAPNEAGALIRTLVDIARSYDMQVEHFFYAMLRSYQEAHDNHFGEIEEAAQRVLEREGWSGRTPLPWERLREVLQGRYGYTVELEALEAHPELTTFRSVFVPQPPQLLVNPRLSRAQQAFQMAREIGYRELRLRERGLASSRAEVSTFEQVLNDFKASYFAGALMIQRDLLVEDLGAFFNRERWDEQAFLAMMGRYQVTPEMFLYRLSQLIPHHFGLKKLHFLRFSNPIDRQVFRLSKQFNMSRVLIPTGIGLNEHYCRRWLSVEVLEALHQVQRRKSGAVPVIGVQRSQLMADGREYFCIALARPLALTPGTNTSVTLGFQVNELFRRRVRFWNDPAVPVRQINQTCERCALGPDECQERVAPPTLYEQQQALERRNEVLHKLVTERGQPAATSTGRG